MKRVTSLVAAVILAVSPMSTALAGGLSKAEIASIFEQQGYSVQDLQRNMLAVSVGEHVVVVGLDGVDGDVSYITYIDGLSADDVGHKFLSKFNSEVKFGRAYIDRDGDVAIQMDRNSSGGVSVKNIESDFDVFLLLVSKFLSDLESIASV